MGQKRCPVHTYYTLTTSKHARAYIQMKAYYLHLKYIFIDIIYKKKHITKNNSKIGSFFFFLHCSTVVKYTKHKICHLTVFKRTTRWR